MKRRNFLRMMVGGITVAAAERTFPFRVFSFPKEVALAPNQIVPMGFVTPVEWTPLGGLRRDVTWFLHPTQYAAYQELYRELLEANVMPDFSQFIEKEVACHSRQPLKA